MGCDEMRELLGPALDGELDAAHTAQLDRHVATCPGCASERRELERLRSAVRGASYHRLTPQGRTDPDSSGEDATDPVGAGAKQGQSDKAEG